MVASSSLCSVCGTESSSFHLGVQACRACAVFFRRTRERSNPYECKSRGQCDTVNFPCKKCRFDKFSQLLKEKKLKRAATKQTADLSVASTSFPSEQPPLPVYEPPQRDGESIIDKLRSAYRMVGLVRRTAELSMRPERNREHPLNIGMGEYSLHLTTTPFMNEASRILVSSLVQFATESFEEFGDLSSEDKWLLIQHFHKPFHIYDSCYRSNEAFPGKLTRHFNSFTSFLDIENCDDFVKSAPDNSHYEDAVRMARFHLEHNVRPCRIAMERFDPSEEEFLAMIGIQFWTIDMTLPVSDDIFELAAKYRSIVLRDLRQHYAQTGVTEYGARIGEMFCTNNLLSEKVECNKRNFEVFRLLDIFTDDSFVYSMQK
ncbi:hypothetical protein PENTCL1PPCAC_22163 [Pristionchus entomophagus]|uniref:Nuclear receptor n=1 Tax=Pristionchus entomophagus TaxID=358040 RepID=A0AAV5TZJ2_9BILA|nr:hypothetical protein PENTCL1PPCAC_22163 [Pristionchus entomophagus]